MATPQSPAAMTAHALLDAEAFLINTRDPFTLTSGLRAPFYVNCRRLIYHAEARAAIAEAFAGMIRQTLDLESIDVIAGGVTAGVPFATLAADRLAKPLVYIRPQPKAHGTGEQVEGGPVAGKRVLLIEDLTTTAKSVLAFTQILRKAGAEITDACLIFSRATPEALAAAKQQGITMHVLSEMSDLIAAVRERQAYSEAELDSVASFLADPQAWQQRVGES